jgi:hypothetical protein
MKFTDKLKLERGVKKGGKGENELIWVLWYRQKELNNVGLHNV